MAIVEAWTETRPAEVCERLFTEAGVPCSRYLSVAEALRDEQLVHRGSLAKVKDRDEDYLVPNPPFKFSDARARAGSVVAELGQHSSEILAEVLGMSSQQTAALQVMGALGRQ